MRCVVWTVDQPEWLDRAASLGIKAVITNNPGAMRNKKPSDTK
jgi:glycerophosphoryl diester phosphodiesterase